MKTTSTFVIVATLLVIPVAIASSFLSAPADPWVEVTAQILDTDGAAYNGNVEFYLSQETVTASSHGGKTWGPNPVTVQNGVMSYSGYLTDFDLLSDGVITVYPGDSSNPAERRPTTFLNPADGTRGVSTFSPTVQNGNDVIVVRGLSLNEAPLYGKLTLTGPATTSQIEILFCPNFMGVVGPADVVDTISVSSPGSVVSIYRWPGTDTTSVQFAATSALGHVSPIGILPFSASRPLNLQDVGEVRATISSALTAEAYRVVAFSTPLYSPFQHDPAQTSGANSGLAFMRILDAEIARLSSVAANERVFVDLPVGDYTVEFWRLSDINAVSPSLPAPHSTHIISVTSGATTLLAIN